MIEGLKILVIEDDRDVADTFVDSIRSVDKYAVVDCVHLLFDGLKHLDYEHYDAVILDLILPDSPERDVQSLRMVMRQQPTAVVVVVTGYPDLTDEAIKAGAHAVITKGEVPSFARILLNTIRQSIQRQVVRPYASITSADKLAEVDAALQRLKRQVEAKQELIGKN